MDRNRHHAGALRTFGIKRLELILGAAKELLCVIMLKDIIGISFSSTVYGLILWSRSRPDHDRKHCV
jgi:hypothetical protein